MANTGSCSDGQGLALWNLNPIICWRAGLDALPESCLAWGDPALLYSRDHSELQEDVRQGDLPVLPTPLTRAPPGDPPTLAGGSGSVSCGGTAPLLWVLVHAVSCVPPSLESLLPPVLWKSCNQILLAFKVRFPGDSQPLCQSPGWGACCGVQNLHNSARTSLVLLFSSLWVTHQWVWDLILSWLCLSYCLTCSFFFVFGCGLSFFGGFQHPPVDGHAAAGCDFGALGDGNECTSFYSTILNQNTVLFFFHTKCLLFSISC